MNKIEEEKLLWEGTPSQMVFFWPYVFCFLSAVLVLPIFIALYNYLRIKTTNYTLTNQRIRLREGIINKKTEELELYRILDFSAREPFFLRMFGLGNIILTTMDQSDPLFEISGVSEPQKVLDEIRVHEKVARANSKISEIEIGN